MARPARPTGLLALAAVLLGAAPARAAVPEGPLTLTDCIVRAVAEGPRVRAAREQAELAEARLSETRWASFPRATFIGLFSYAPGTGGDVTETEGDIFDSWGPVVRLELTGEVPLYTFGRLGAEEDAAWHRREAARARVADAVQDVTLRVRRAWYDRLAALARGQAIDAAGATLARVEERVAALDEDDDPALDPTDPVRLRVRSADLLIRRSEATRAAAAAEARLRAELGTPPGAPLALVEAELQPVLLAPGPLAEYVAVARSLNPAVRGLREDESAAREVHRARGRAFFPEVFAAGLVRYGYAGAYGPQLSPFADDQANSWEAAVFLGLRVPLDWPAIVNRREEASAVLSRSAWRRRVESDRVALEVARQHGELADLVALLSGRSVAADAAREWCAARLVAYEEGRVRLDEVLTALAQQVDREIVLVDGVRDLNVAVAGLSRTVGLDAAALRSATLPPDGEAELPLPAGLELPPDLSPELREKIREHLRRR